MAVDQRGGLIYYWILVTGQAVDTEFSDKLVDSFPHSAVRADRARPMD